MLAARERVSRATMRAPRWVLTRYADLLGACVFLLTVVLRPGTVGVSRTAERNANKLRAVRGLHPHHHVLAPVLRLNISIDASVPTSSPARKPIVLPPPAHPKVRLDAAGNTNSISE